MTPLVADGHAARADLDRASTTVTQLADEDAELAAAADRLVDAERRAQGLDACEGPIQRPLRLCSTPPGPSTPWCSPPSLHNRTAGRLPTAPSRKPARRATPWPRYGARPPPPAPTPSGPASRPDRSSSLSGEADCPLCGQALGAAFESVQAHRAAELAEATSRLDVLTAEQHRSEKRAAVAAGRPRRGQGGSCDGRRRPGGRGSRRRPGAPMPPPLCSAPGRRSRIRRATCLPMLPPSPAAGRGRRGASGGSERGRRGRPAPGAPRAARRGGGQPGQGPVRGRAIQHPGHGPPPPGQGHGLRPGPAGRRPPGPR